MVKAVLCDIDGTLVDSNWLHAEAWQRAFAEMGIELDRETARRQIGKGGDELIRCLCRGGSTRRWKSR
jgi:beta-phosphoglucomutase-like phosphatase (HAD superfamily)